MDIVSIFTPNITMEKGVEEPTDKLKTEMPSMCVWLSIAFLAAQRLTKALILYPKNYQCKPKMTSIITICKSLMTPISKDVKMYVIILPQNFILINRLLQK